MGKIIYYVASSLDGYISGPDEDISRFAQQGNGVEKYLSDLKDFDTVIMGKNTYEFGYKFGLQPGQPAYPHMEHYIFSNSMALNETHNQVHVEKIDLTRVDEITKDSKGNIYLCGGGIFAGWLLDNNRIDEVKIKLNPIILGGGTKLFGESTAAANLKLQSTDSYDGGLQIMTYTF